MATADLFEQAAEANVDASCRNGSIDEIEADGELIATGDLHDNPMHFARVLELARHAGEHPRHLTLHEVIHSDRLVGGVDLSHRALARVAEAKVRDPERVHTLLANHELSQIIGAGIVKDGVRVVDAFNEGVEYVYGDDAPLVEAAIARFIRSMPLALVWGRGTGRGCLCAHSLPAPGMMERFTPDILDRGIDEADYAPRQGSAHLMVWGRGHSPEQLDELADIWGVETFILGHEKADSGFTLVGKRAVVLNSDHQAGMALRVDLASPPLPPLGIDSLELIPLASGL